MRKNSIFPQGNDIQAVLSDISKLGLGYIFDGKSNLMRLSLLIAAEMKTAFNSESCIVRASRLALNLTQIEFAERMDSSLRSIQGWECGLRTPKIDIMIKCVKALGCSYNLFFKTYEQLQDFAVNCKNKLPQEESENEK